MTVGCIVFRIITGVRVWPYVSSLVAHFAQTLYFVARCRFAGDPEVQPLRPLIVCAPYRDPEGPVR